MSPCSARRGFKTHQWRCPWVFTLSLDHKGPFPDGLYRTTFPSCSAYDWMSWHFHLIHRWRHQGWAIPVSTFPPYDMWWGRFSWCLLYSFALSESLSSRKRMLVSPEVSRKESWLRLLGFPLCRKSSSTRTVESWTNSCWRCSSSYGLGGPLHTLQPYVTFDLLPQGLSQVEFVGFKAFV